MDAVIEANTPVDYIEFHIVPSQNRYEACVCYEKKKEKVKSGLLEHLLLHSVDIKPHSRESDNKYKLYPPENLHDNKWFTKTTLIRFLHIIGSANLLEVANSLQNEISQLEEARRFHLSLYAKADDSDASKNELLRAMDLRLNALREELTTAFDQAAGARYSVEDMTDLEMFSRHLGSTDLSDSLGKHIELIRGAQTVQNSSIRHFSESDRVKPKEKSNHIANSVYSELPVVYGVSPAKAAQVERQCSTESDESSFSSEEERPSAERSRTLIRSASPRRSASPMRRIQIGRSGSRRSTAITIKSLNYIPSRDRMFKDSADDSDEEESEQAPKKAENNVRRMSVQDAISLFERKQNDQTVNIQKARSLLSASIGANKSVLRRWSSGMGEDSSQCPQDEVHEIQNNVECKEVTYSPQESEAEQGVASKDFSLEPCESDVKLNSPEKEECTPEVMQEETRPTESTDVNGRLINSAEWSRRKEAELNELLMKMMETKPVKSRTALPARSKRQSLPSEQRGGFYDHYKEKRDEKLQGEAAKKKEGKDKQFKGSLQILDAKKSQLSPANGDTGRKHDVKKLQKPQISASQPANPKAESPKLGVVKKVSAKASSLPATRKSWPSMPSPGARGPPPGGKGLSPGARGPSPAKTPGAPSSTGAVPTRRMSQPTSAASKVSSKVETSQIRTKSIKPNQNDSKKILKPALEKKQLPVTKSKKTTKSNVQIATEENLVTSAKPNLYSKVTKKSSVVPLESKPFLRKGSGNTSGVNPTVKKKASLQEPLRKSEDLTLAEDNQRVSKSSDLVVQHEERENKEFETHMSAESGNSTQSLQQCNDNGDLGEIKTTTADGANRIEEPELRAEAEVEVEVEVEVKAEAEAEEESTISPTAWVEIEEQDHSMVHGEHSNQMAVSPAYKAPVGASSPRVRHSLSQMLLEESSEPDGIDWGIAENPPATVYHKDAPKGLKRLLKFARKSKTETNSSGWSSPSVFSEGEDDSEDSRLANKRSSDNLLRIATHHSLNNGHQKNFSDYEHHAQTNIRKVDAQSLTQQFQEGNVSASVTTTKATRSFFSLSAFKGNK